jgi:hypothetical protein
VTAVVLGALVASARGLREGRGPTRPAWALLGLGVLLRLDVGVVYASFLALASPGRRARSAGAALLAA